MQLYSCSSLRAIVIIKDEKKGTKVNCNAAALIYSVWERDMKCTELCFL